MARLIKRLSKKICPPPGTLVHVGERKIEKTRIRVIDYDETNLQVIELKNH